MYHTHRPIWEPGGGGWGRGDTMAIFHLFGDKTQNLKFYNIFLIIFVACISQKHKVNMEKEIKF